MVDRRLRALSLFMTVVLSTGVIGSWYVGELFPWLHVSVYAAVILVVLTLGFDIDGISRYYWSLSVLCVIGVVFRVPMVLFPGTLSGNDPEKYALFARLTLLTDRYPIPGLNFYGTAGAFHTYVAQTSAISGIAPEDAMVVIGLFVGLWAPLVAASFSLALLGRSEVGYQAALLAAAVATVASISVRMSFVPFAQSLGTVLLVTLLYVAIKQIDASRPALGVVILLLSAAMAVSHKLPLIAAVPVVGFVWLTTRVSASGYVPWIPTRRHLSFWVVVVIAAAAVIQQLVITSFLDDALLLAENAALGGVPSRTGAQPQAASVPDVGLLGVFESHSHAPVTLLLGGLSWVVTAWVLLLRNDQPRATVVAFLATIASMVVMTAATAGSAVIPQGINPFRFYALVEILLAGLIGVGVVIVLVRSRYARAPVLLLLVLVVLFNGFAASAAPDHPGQQRQYLTPEEITAKQFAVDHVPGEIYTDARYMRQTPYPERVTEKTDPWIRLGAAPSGTQFSSFNGELVNGTAVSENHPTIMYRTGEDIYETGGRFRDYRYRLEWDVETAADSEYHRVYDNRDVLIYRNTTV